MKQPRRLVAFSHPTQSSAAIHRRSCARQHFPEKIRHRAHGGTAAHVFVHHQIQRRRAGGRGFVCAQCHCLQAVCGRDREIGQDADADLSGDRLFDGGEVVTGKDDVSILTNLIPRAIFAGKTRHKCDVEKLQL